MTRDTGPFQADLTDLQPSQLYISADKLEEIEQSRRGSVSPVEPLPVKRLQGRTVLTDGHTRAFAALLRGESSVSVQWDEDDLDWEAYQICVDWCLCEGIQSVLDLRGRIVSAKEYEVLWLDRCRAMQEELAGQRGTVVLHHGQREIPPAGVRALYDLMGWWPCRRTEEIEEVLRHGDCFGAWDGDTLVGFVRAVSDGRFRAYIEDHMVHPEYRRRGVGTALLDAVLVSLRSVETVSLFCDRELMDKHQRLGFRHHPKQVVMHRSPSDREAGS